MNILAIFTKAWKIFAANMAVLLPLTLIAFVGTVIAALLEYIGPQPAVLVLLLSFIAMVWTFSGHIIADAAIRQVAHSALKQNPCSISHALAAGARAWPRLLGFFILATAALVLGAMLLLFPALFVTGFLLTFGPAWVGSIIIEGKGVRDGWTRTRELTSNHWSQVFAASVLLILGLAIPIGLLAALLPSILLLPLYAATIAFSSVAQMVIYHELVALKENEQGPNLDS